MIRAMIGTVAVLAGFAVVERSVDASTGLASACTPTQAYAMLPRGDVVPVRSEPTPGAAVIGALTKRDGTGTDPARSVVTLTASQGGWACLALGSAGDYHAIGRTAAQPYGWLPADLLEVDARIAGPITAYDRPGLLGHPLATIEDDDVKFRVLGCRGDWLQVINARHGTIWIDRWCAREDGCRG